LFFQQKEGFFFLFLSDFNFASFKKIAKGIKKSNFYRKELISAHFYIQKKEKGEFHGK